MPDAKKAFKVGMDQAKWDALDEQARALHVMNLERTDRGLDPISAVVNPLKTIATDYAAFLQAKASPDGGEVWTKKKGFARVRYHTFFLFLQQCSLTGSRECDLTP